MERAAKKELVTTLGTVFKNAEMIVVAHYAGLSVAQMTKLRRRMKEAGATVKVTKNRIAKIALVGTDIAGISGLLKGPTVLAYSKDPVGTAKVATIFAKENEKFVILGGSMGKTVLTTKDLKALSELPSLDQLRAKLVGLLVTPATQIARIVMEPGTGIARVIKAKSEQAAA